MKFHATIEATGGKTTGIEIPPDILTKLGASKRPAVQMTING